ncbi:hypothetical protein HELRODRAFT_183957 [Helobdella robusta]|uniref:Uncharacterized protein n=1 Tax=Helobdella robusta TaxID=6412 RepID=T1FKC6_HELRO|nr:hypothetical protein HELRODRAFT_183957 [Helobdella robusta]ESO09690.1 hypothetical protein HELRODRAFT_183957 [Helobdella robusta]
MYSDSARYNNSYEGRRSRSRNRRQSRYDSSSSDDEYSRRRSRSPYCDCRDFDYEGRKSRFRTTKRRVNCYQSRPSERHREDDRADYYYSSANRNRHDSRGKYATHSRDEKSSNFYQRTSYKQGIKRKRFQESYMAKGKNEQSYNNQSSNYYKRKRDEDGSPYDTHRTKVTNFLNGSPCKSQLDESSDDAESQNNADYLKKEIEILKKATTHCEIFP